jgi:hypothetical protein
LGELFGIDYIYRLFREAGFAGRWILAGSPTTTMPIAISRRIAGRLRVLSLNSLLPALALHYFMGSRRRVQTGSQI